MKLDVGDQAFSALLEKMGAKLVEWKSDAKPLPPRKVRDLMRCPETGKLILSEPYEVDQQGRHITE